MMRPKRWLRMDLLSLLGPLILVLCGCSQVRLIRDTPEGGIVTLPNNSNQWPTYYRNRATYLMKEKCPEGYVIDFERVIEDNPAADDGRKPNEHFEYNGAYERIANHRREVYQIAFHRAAGGKNAAPNFSTPDPAKEIAPFVSPPAPTSEDDKNELPPPRPLPPRSQP